jgi:hypothetical protein
MGALEQLFCRRGAEAQREKAAEENGDNKRVNLVNNTTSHPV